MFLIIPFLPLIAAGLTAGGALGGAALARGGSRRAIREQNEYNHPKNQLQRIREAGLPAAAMFGGTHAGNQSVVAESGSGLHEGVKGGIDAYIQTTMQQKQLEALQATIDKTKAEKENVDVSTDIQTVNYDLLRDKAYNYDLASGDGINGTAIGGSNQIANAIREQELKKADNYLRNNQGMAIELEMDIKKAKTPHEIDEIKTRIKSMLTDMNIKWENLAIQKADLNMRQLKFPLEQEELGQKIANMKLEAGLYPLREHQMVLSNRILYSQTLINKMTDKIVRQVQQGGIGIGEAIVNSILFGKMNLNPVSLVK